MGLHQVDASHDTDQNDGKQELVARQAEIDLVILDLTMPTMDGAEAFAEIRRLDPDARVILASGYSADDVVARIPGRVPTGVVQKPYTLSLLREALRNAEV